MQRVWAFGLFLAGLILPMAVSWPQEDYKKMLPEAEGKQLVVELCGTCQNAMTFAEAREMPKRFPGIAAAEKGR